MESNIVNITGQPLFCFSCDIGPLNTPNLSLPVTRTVVGMLLGRTLWDLMIFAFPDILLISNNSLKEYTFDPSDSEQDG